MKIFRIGDPIFQKIQRNLEENSTVSAQTFGGMWSIRTDQNPLIFITGFFPAAILNGKAAFQQKNQFKSRMPVFWYIASGICTHSKMYLCGNRNLYKFKDTIGFKRIHEVSPLSLM